MFILASHVDPAVCSGTSPTRTGVGKRPCLPVLTLAKIYLIANEALESRTTGVRV